MWPRSGRSNTSPRTMRVISFTFQPHCLSPYPMDAKDSGRGGGGGGGGGGVEWSWTISGSRHSTQLFAFFRKCCVCCLNSATAPQLSSAAQFTQLGCHVCVSNCSKRSFYKHSVQKLFLYCLLSKHTSVTIYRNVTLVLLKRHTNR